MSGCNNNSPDQDQFADKPDQYALNEQTEQPGQLADIGSNQKELMN